MLIPGYTYDVVATDVPGGQLGDEPVAVTDWRNVVLRKYGGDVRTVKKKKKKKNS